MLILGIESSCDETAAAVVRDGREILSNVISSQIEIHRRFGGVVPEIASRNHTLQIRSVVDEALREAKVSMEDIDAIAVTYGAGLVGALLVGVSYAKALSYATGKPLYAVNHIRGHIASNYLTYPELEPPFMCLIVSGGHTAIARVSDYTDIEVVGSTTDDACGEACDKVARILGLPYPGGPEIDRLAREGEDNIVFMKKKRLSGFDLSYSGLKTAVMNYVNNETQKGTPIRKADVARSFQSVAMGMLVDSTERALKKYRERTLVIAGGVSANSELRRRALEMTESLGARCYFPDMKLCTDNAAMIASAAYYDIRSGKAPSELTLNADPSLEI